MTRESAMTKSLLNELEHQKTEDSSESSSFAVKTIGLGSTLQSLLGNSKRYSKQIKGHYVLLKQMKEMKWLDKLNFSARVHLIAKCDKPSSSGCLIR